VMSRCYIRGLKLSWSCALYWKTHQLF